MQQSNLLSNVPKIKALFDQNPTLPQPPLEATFHLKFHDHPEHVEIEVCQFIFTRSTIHVPKASNDFEIITSGQPPVTGEDSVEALQHALQKIGYIRTPEQALTRMFTMAKTTKTKYPRKGKVRRK
jgi:hypothetical protein